MSEEVYRLLAEKSEGEMPSSLVQLRDRVLCAIFGHDLARSECVYEDIGKLRIAAICRRRGCRYMSYDLVDVKVAEVKD